MMNELNKALFVGRFIERNPRIARPNYSKSISACIEKMADLNEDNRTPEFWRTVSTSLN